MESYVTNLERLIYINKYLELQIYPPETESSQIIGLVK